MTIRYAPMERHSDGLVPTKGYLRYMHDYSCDLDHALALGMTNTEYVEVLDSCWTDDSRE